MNFSKEDIFFIQNWEIIEKLYSSKENFEREFSKVLYSIEEILVKQDWWNKGLVFKKNTKSEVYISRENWRLNDEYSIWIGVQDFTPQQMLGSDFPAICYLWVTGDKEDKIMNDLSRIFKNKGQFEDYLVNSDGYVLEKPLKKYTEEEYKKFISGASLKEIVEFIEKVYLIIKSYKI